MNRFLPLILAAALLASGCAQSQSGLTPVFPPGKVAPSPELPAKSLLTLEQVPPPTKMPSPRPATRPGEPPPVESLALFARARDEMLDNHAQVAVDILTKAIALDPDSYELYRAMGEARLAVAKQPNQDEIDAFEKAAELRPDDLRLQALLGAQLAALGQTDKALLHLRLAVQTDEYKFDDVAAAAVDLLLAQLLKVQGYDRAALDQYQVLLQRLAAPSYDLRSDPELGGLAAQPQPLMFEIAGLYENLGRWSEALTVYEPLAAADPSNFELQARVVHMLTNLGRTSDAIRGASDVLLRFDASGDAIDLLKQVCIQQNVDMAEALALLCKSHPDETALRLAYAQILTERGRLPEAQQVLESAAARAGGPAKADWRVLDKLFDIYLRRDDVPSAAKLLVDFFASHPDSASQLDTWWTALTGPSRPDALRVATLQKLKVDPASEAAKNFLIWRMATTWRRDVLAHSSLDAAVHSGKPFAPAFRQIIEETWLRKDWADSRKLVESDQIAKLAERGGDGSLALEIHGLALFNMKRPAEAILFLEKALAAGGSSAQLTLNYATALHGVNQDAKAEQTLQHLVAEHPQFDQAWEVLFQLFLGAQQEDDARKTLSNWLTADPASIPARVLQAELAVRDNDLPGGEEMLLKLFNDHPENVDVIQALVGLAPRTGHLQQLIDKLQALRTHQPNNVTATQWLVELYVSESRAPDAVKTLDATRKAVASDADLLYAVAHLYEQVDQAKTTEEVLDQVVKLDPSNASACNDLGYTWADEGRNLPRAESLIRVAIGQEPDNQSFLDSMGWVLYKQGKFGDAEPFFEKAVGPAVEPDPVVLNHYGDVLYRLGRTGDATAQWRTALTGLDSESPDRADLRDLRQSLTRKIAEQNAGQSVSVAPTGATK